MKKRFLIIRFIAFGLLLLLISGCASYGVIKNVPQKAAGDAEIYSIRSFVEKWRVGDMKQKDGPLILINAVTDVQLHRCNAATLKLMNQSVIRWAKELSTPERPVVTPYFIQIGFRDIQQPEKRRFFNRIPTSFSLSDEQVDRLIGTGRELLRKNPDFQRFLSDLGAL